MFRFAACVALCLLFATSLMAAPSKSAAALNSLAEEYMRAFYGFSPSLATRAGVHHYDSQMDDLSRESFEKQIAAYRDFEKRFTALPTAGLTESERADREMMIARVRAGLFDIDGNRWWDRDPDRYSAIVSDSAFVLMQRNFAPAKVRLSALVERERKMPLVFAAARVNLKNPPRVYTQVAIDQLPGIISFFKKDVPEAFAGVKDAKLQAEFKATNERVVQAMEQYLDFLKKDLLARSNGDFRIGAEKYAKKLANEEMVDIPLDRLLQVGRENLQRNQEEFARVAKLIDPNRTPQQILEELQKEHPAPDKLLEAFRSRLSGLRSYIAEKHIMTTPAQTMPTLEETPPFMRALTFASMDAPGPFETRATEAYFNVTLPEKNWTPEQVEEHMQGFNYGTITSTSIHETFPGHYEQYLWNERMQSKIRKFLSLDMTTVGGHFSGSNQEGWAHYTEQMMLDEGYGRTAGVPEEKDKEFLKLRIGQLQDALLRNARYIVGIEMHTGQMTFEQGVEFFQKEGYQTKATATSETKRGTSDPTYLVYTLGKLEILKLREDYKKKMGAKFSLQDFHDRLMEQGVAPIKLIRRSMLGNDSPAL
jgi:uncharacterized protein (DUF885 family)